MMTSCLLPESASPLSRDSVFSVMSHKVVDINESMRCVYCGKKAVLLDSQRVVSSVKRDVSLMTAVWLAVISSINHDRESKC